MFFSLLQILRRGSIGHDLAVNKLAGDGDPTEARDLIWRAYMADVIGLSNDGTIYLNR